MDGELRFEIVDDAEEFARMAGPVLRRDAVGHTVPLSVLDGIRTGRFAEHVLARVSTGDGVVGLGVRTPPHSLVVAAAPKEALFALADGLLDAGVELPGVNGTEPNATAFAARWSERTGCGLRQNRGLRLFRTDEVTAPRPAPGRSRPAAPPDLPRLVDWTCAFLTETGVVGAADTEQEVRREIEGGRLWVWDDDGPVSMTGRRPTLAGVARVGPVYTPVPRRGRGYASNLVAEVTSAVLAEPAVPVLFTDLANPTSNAIYTALGYRRVCDAREIEFLPGVVG